VNKHIPLVIVILVLIYLMNGVFDELLIHKKTAPYFVPRTLLFLTS